jgi:retinol dehydrogenase 12
MSTTNDLADRTFLITGCNTGIGKATAFGLAARGAKLTLANRSIDKTKAVVDELKQKFPNVDVDVVALDLADLASVRACAQTLLDKDRSIDVLINNAGLAGMQGETKDGFEIVVGTNHLGHHLFTHLLMNKILQSKAPRIVNVSSRSHYSAKKIDPSLWRGKTRTRTSLNEYGVSKCLQVLHARHLSKIHKEKNLVAVSLHPGVVASDVWRHVPGFLQPIMKLFMISNEEGAQTSLFCATAQTVSSLAGAYFSDSAEKTPNRIVTDALAARTDAWSNEAVGIQP